MPDDINAPSTLPQDVLALRALSDEEIEQQGAAAEQQIASLREAVANATQQAAAAGEAFRTQPSAETATAQLVADQVLANAKQAVERAEQQSTAVRAERARRRALARMADLEPVAFAEDLLDGVSQRWGAILSALREQLGAEMQRAQTEIGQARDAAIEYRSVATSVSATEWRINGGESRGDLPAFPNLPPDVTLDRTIQRLQRDHQAAPHRNGALSIHLEHEHVVLVVRTRIAG